MKYTDSAFLLGDAVENERVAEMFHLWKPGGLGDHHNSDIEGARSLCRSSGEVSAAPFVL